MFGLYRRVRDAVWEWIEAKVKEAAARNARALDDD